LSGYSPETNRKLCNFLQVAPFPDIQLVYVTLQIFENSPRFHLFTIYALHCRNPEVFAMGESSLTYNKFLKRNEEENLQEFY